MVGDLMEIFEYATLEETVTRGRQWLTGCTGQDFGFDLLAWHQYLVETGDGGYKWNNAHRGYPREIESALADETWRHAANIAERQDLLTQLNERDERQQNKRDAAEREWIGQSRCCPKCTTEFTSDRDLAECTKCGRHFYASHPDDLAWWLDS